MAAAFVAVRSCASNFGCGAARPLLLRRLYATPNTAASFPTAAADISSSSSAAPSSSTLATTTTTSMSATADRHASPFIGGDSGSAIAPADQSAPPALQQARVADIVVKGPIAEDFEGGSARHANAVGAMWSNIPAHVRASFTTPSSMEDAPKTHQPMVLDDVWSKTKQLVARTGLAPSHWHTAADEAAPYYGGQISLVPYKKGQTAAYHYPKVLVPRTIANRFPLDMYVDPIFQTGSATEKIRMKGFTLFPRLQGKTTLLLVFSGQPLSGLWTGLRHWTNSIGEEFKGLPQTQIFKLHAEEGWFNRRTHQLTKFHLRRQVPEEELWSTFVYRGKWKWEYVYNLHLYNKELPVVLLIDKVGYIRWHAIGLPTPEATSLFKQLARRLAHEKAGVS
eukprot:TRINITY_DN31504_c0_g1_i1.p1 TRINITY_DN31504_c0_g1~~TRINITY_DN31504_c0_g1_i1.p1  ORF type:complete len:394 (-),score=75.21 TRINITY_DN31504_c0_g1_i1:116-1297(-)